MVVAAVALGCQSSPWSAKSAAPSASPTTTVAQAPVEPSSGEVPSTEATKHVARDPDPGAVEAMVAEIRQSQSLDPKSEQELRNNLQATSPELWPLVMQQFRAALAYRRQAEERERHEHHTEMAATAAPSFSQSVEKTASHPGAPRTLNPETPARVAQPQPDRPPLSSQAPAASSSALASPRGAGGEVMATSYEPRVPGDWRLPLADAVRVLESKVSAEPQSAEQIAEHARLRMLYLTQGRRDDAMRPIPGLSPAMQDFWANEFCGLAALLDPQQTPDAMRRAGEAERHLSTALDRLSESAPLLVRNLAFVTDVQSYGAYKQFDAYLFQPGQRVLLYAEIENFKSKETARGFHTALQSSHQILDSRGQRVTEHDFGTNEEYCRNPRRDFFIGYEFYLPKQIYAGKYTLQLTVTDLNSDKIAQSTIDFTVRGLE